ncbi:hypothetical protein HOG48_01670 [Candidatus Peregrinibacteria bacterium]|jgi:hypothetical protein|nr:hypothetical protein [Candidatus Peregrinibacteria bacterium]
MTVMTSHVPHAEAPDPISDHMRQVERKELISDIYYVTDNLWGLIDNREDCQVRTAFDEQLLVRRRHRKIIIECLDEGGANIQVIIERDQSRTHVRLHPQPFNGHLYVSLDNFVRQMNDLDVTRGSTTFRNTRTLEEVWRWLKAIEKDLQGGDPLEVCTAEYERKAIVSARKGIMHLVMDSQKDYN